MRIDAHAHCWPPAYLDLLARNGSTRTEFARTLQAGDSPAEIAARLSEMDRLGIDVQIVSVLSQAPHLPELDPAVEAARLANDSLARLARTHPDRIRAFGVLPLPHVDAAHAEIARALDDLGMAGIAVTATVLGRSLADPAFVPLLAELNERRAVLFVHPTGEGGGPHVDEHGLQWSVGAAFEDTLAAVHLLQAKVDERFPKLRMVFCHLGGALAMIAGRLGAQLGPSRMANLQTFWFDNVDYGHQPAVRCAVETFGAERIVLGSDYPFRIGEPVTNIPPLAVLDENVSRLFTDGK